MYSRKTEIYKDLNVLSEKRYISKKFLFEEEDKNETIKLQVTPIQGKVNKYKISYFEKQPNGNLKDVLTDELLVKIGFNVEYASQDSAQIDIDKKNTSEIQKKIKDSLK
jgi:hypothetical protein